MTKPRSPPGSGKASYQSPPTPNDSAATNRVAISKPATSGIRVGSRLRCMIRAAWRSESERSATMVTAIRSAASWTTAMSSSLNSRGSRVPTWRTPTSRPAATIGTPSIVRRPLRSSRGLTTTSGPNLVDDDRPALGGHSPGEASPERDPGALEHLLLQTTRGVGDELAAGAVEQQDRPLVDAERLLETAEQLVGDGAGVEIGERRRDRSHARRLRQCHPRTRRYSAARRLRSPSCG